MDFLLITRDPEVARYAIDCGVDRIFVDLEMHGKQERQGHLDAVMSGHCIADIDFVRSAIGNSRLLVRINPIHQGTPAEVESVLNAGADEIMLPMFRSAAELEAIVCMVQGRARIIPLIETPAALTRLPRLLQVAGIDEFYLGLNDLHLAMQLDFMFELLAGGLIDHASTMLRAEGKRFGFGGIARLDQGEISGEMVMGEHVRLGSSSVILSRSFHGRSVCLADFRANIDLRQEVERLKSCQNNMATRAPLDIERHRRVACAAVWKRIDMAGVLCQ